MAACTHDSAKVDILGRGRPLNLHIKLRLGKPFVGPLPAWTFLRCLHSTVYCSANQHGTQKRGRILKKIFLSTRGLFGFRPRISQGLNRHHFLQRFDQSLLAPFWWLKKAGPTGHVLFWKKTTGNQGHFPFWVGPHLETLSVIGELFGSLGNRLRL